MSVQTQSPTLAVENVSFSYDTALILQSISLDVEPGEVLALVGPNGSGKTTLLKLMSGVLSPDVGGVQFAGTHLGTMKAQQRAKHIAALEQEHHISFEFTSREVVSWGRIPHRSRFARWAADDEQAVVDAMRQTNTLEFASRTIHTLSGGERQRVFIAMALAQQPQVLLLDEPTAHLDLKHQYEVLTLIQSLADRGITVVTALHDLHAAMRYAHRVAVLDEGQLECVGPPQQTLTESVISRVWQLPSNVFAGFEPMNIPG